MGAGDWHLAHPSHVLDPVTARLVPDQPDHIDAHFVEEHAVRDKPPDREPPQPGALAPGGRLERLPYCVLERVLTSHITST